MPHNFSAVYAIMFCAGLYLPGWGGWTIPLVLMVVIDLLITLVFYSSGDFSLWQFAVGMAPNYLAYAGLIGLGRFFGEKRPWWMLVIGGMFGALLFYIVTNTAAWLQLDGYAKTLAGWLQALTIGLPGLPSTWEFFRNTLISGGLFTGLFVVAMKLTEAAEESEEEKEAEPAEEPAPAADGEPADSKS